MKLIIFTASRRLKIYFDKISGDLQAGVVKRNIFFLWEILISEQVGVLTYWDIGIVVQYIKNISLDTLWHILDSNITLFVKIFH